jgi:hypothetical protein
MYITMVNDEIKLLTDQIEKLGSTDFDFDAWKKYSLLILTRIFGSNDPKVLQLNGIDFEFNSWSLRDASGNESYEEGSKKLAREVLTAAIDELNIYGLPKSGKESTKGNTEEIVAIILDEFKGSQVKELRKILNSRSNMVEKKRLVKELIEELGDFTSIEILTNILTSKSVKPAIDS